MRPRLIVLGATVTLASCMASAQMTALRPDTNVCARNLGFGVAWYRPVLGRDDTQLDRWCRTVAPTASQHIPTAVFGTERSQQELTIASWNTDAGAGDVVGFLQDELGIQCRGRASGLMPDRNHFVLLVQEALRRTPQLRSVEESWVTPPPVLEERPSGPRVDIVDVAAMCGLSLFYAPAARNGAEQRDGEGEDKGNAILATLPLSDLTVIELPFESTRRVTVVATVRLPGGDSLRVASVHFITTPQAWRVLTTANTSRLRQSLAVINALHLIEDRHVATETNTAFEMSTIVAGDLNTWSNQEHALRVLLKQFPDSPLPLMERTSGPFPTDHVLFRARRAPVNRDKLLPESYRKIDSTYYSDHHPLVVTYRPAHKP